MKNRYFRITFIISVLLILVGLLLNILHYKIGFINGYGLIILGLVMNINAFFFIRSDSKGNKQ